ncbi:MAG: 6-phosphofructokinase, partial [Flavobacteriaceae bacterium]
TKGKRNEMGIVLKRRDNAPIVKDVYGGVIDILMKEKNIQKAIDYVHKCLQDLVDGNVPIEKLIITKSLRSFYKNPQGVAHKVLADRIAQRDPGNKPTSGDRIPFVYIVTKLQGKGKKVLQGDKIETPTFIKENNLQIDYSFYITNQIMKPLLQLFGLVLKDIWLSQKPPRRAKVTKLQEAIDKIRDTAISHNRLFFVEVMGRDAGHIALNTGIGAGAEEILIPEENMGLERLLESLSRSEKSGKSSSIVVIAEGDKTGKNVFEIAEYVEKNMPHYEVRVSVLGHMQRGGSPSCFDRVLASRMGVQAVESLLEGASNVMVGLKEDKMILTPLDKAIKGKSKINKNLIRVSDILSL